MKEISRTSIAFFLVLLNFSISQNLCFAENPYLNIGEKQVGISASYYDHLRVYSRGQYHPKVGGRNYEHTDAK